MIYKSWDGRSGYAGKRHTGRNILLGLLSVILLCFITLQIVIGVHSRDRFENGHDPAVMVVFGCKVEPWGPSVLLQDRLDTALAYLNENPDVIAVLSGGKGKDEPVSEAQSMYDYLTSKGIDGSRLLREDESHNTWQNINETMELLHEEGYDTTGDFILVSSGFHLARIDMLWDRAGGSHADLLAAPVSHIPSAVQMFFREPPALVKSFILDR